MISSIKVKPSLLYTSTDDGFMCKLCGFTSKYQTNTIRHIHSHEIDNADEEYSSFTYNGYNILKKTEQVLLWKSSHGIPLYALCDELLTSILPENTITSDKTNQKIVNSMAEQIIEKNYSFTTDKNVSLIFDGGSILRTKWIAFGYLMNTDIGLRFQILDVKIFDICCTAENIRNTISEISDKIKGQYNGQITGACTDNAVNFINAFLDEESKIDSVDSIRDCAR